MFRNKSVTVFRSEDVVEALSRSLAIIEFDLTGKILSANDNFCRVMGYERSEIVGRNHSLFVDPTYARTAEYQAFWDRLGRGEFNSAEFKRIGKDGKEVWIQASYNPIRNGAGKVIGVSKAATDITTAKLRSAEAEGKIDAISRAQAMIEFTPQGEILTANQAFLDTLGYRLEDIRGQQHRMFVDPVEAASKEYAGFWARLNAGEFVASEFKRIGKGGRQVWINASYNPIFDPDGRVLKIVKFATDVTARVKAVESVRLGLAELAENNLQHRIADKLDPRFEELRNNFNRSLERLQEAMSQVAHGARAIRSGAEEISRASGDLSKRTEQQAANLEETAAALDEITATVQRSAEGARRGAATAGDARKHAAHSGEVMRDAVTAMGDIERSSAQITQIIGVIDEIAFQTNLLALNAGVEAARAGDAGRGFAVVAQEVRALAQRSAEAAKEIKALIAASTQQVQRGVLLVGATGEALDAIVGKVAEIDNVISEIARSAQEQAVGLSQVNTAINQMDQVTQQNAAMVEESTAAAAGLRNETAQLVDSVGRFRIGERHDPVGRAHERLGASFAA